MREGVRENREGTVGGQQWTLVSPRRGKVSKYAGNMSGNVRGIKRQQKEWGQQSAAKGQANVEGAGVVSFYFTNFPPSYGIEALWGLFMKWGKVVDVFVPGKRNKEGKAFGFVRFKDVWYPNELERRLDQIWIGTYKIKANYTRFTRQKVVGETHKEQQRKAPATMQYQHHRKQQEVKGASYVDVVKGKLGNKKWRKKINGANSDEWRGLDFVANEEDIACRLNNCFVGCVHNPNVVDLLQDRIVEEGVTNFNITPMGGDMVLIKPVEGEDFVELVKDYEDLVESWFYDIRSWSPKEVAREREAWIRCQGVPVQGWSDQLFEMLANTLGSFISLDWSTMQKKCFDFARILIRTTSWEAVNRLIKVRINGVVFSIRLLEEPFQDYGFGMGRSPGGAKKGSSCSSSDSDQMDLSDFSFGSSDEAQIDPRVEEEFQNLLGGQGIRVEKDGRRGSGTYVGTEEVHGDQAYIFSGLEYKK